MASGRRRQTSRGRRRHTPDRIDPALVRAPSAPHSWFWVPAGLTLGLVLVSVVPAGRRQPGPGSFRVVGGHRITRVAGGDLPATEGSGCRPVAACGAAFAALHSGGGSSSRVRVLGLLLATSLRPRVAAGSSARVRLRVRPAALVVSSGRVRARLWPVPDHLQHQSVPPGSRTTGSIFSS